MIVSNPSLLVSEPPAIDSTEARWAVEYLSLMIAQLGSDSPVGLLLKQARRELGSFAHEDTPSTESPPTVVGPLRIAA